MNCSAAGNTYGCCVGSSGQNKCFVGGKRGGGGGGRDRRGNCCPDIKDVGCHGITTLYKFVIMSFHRLDFTEYI